MGSAIAEHGMGPEALRANERTPQASGDARPTPPSRRRRALALGVAARDALVRRTPDGARYRQLDAAIGAH